MAPSGWFAFELVLGSTTNPAGDGPIIGCCCFANSVEEVGVDLVVLSVVRAQSETYGYAIGQRLVADGIKDLKEAAIYACLRRLQDRGLLSSVQVIADNGKARRYYELTEVGEAHLKAEQQAWESRTDVVAGIIEAGRVK